MTEETKLITRLVDTAVATPWFLDALTVVRGLDLPPWCIGAGAVRSLIWDSLHTSSAQACPPGDIDVAYFDPLDVSRQRDKTFQARLRSIRPDFEWDVTNQAGVHHWYPDYFGCPFEPLSSLEEAVGSWPEYATCIGLRLLNDDSVEVIAPHGLDDLFAMIVRYNPARASVDSYRSRLAQKQYKARWPGVTIVPA